MPVTFGYADAGTELMTTQPIIDVDLRGRSARSGSTSVRCSRRKCRS